ncbi:MAG: Lrp/AsnC family transcriptional regulator [Bacteroidota bacterium]
MALSGLDAIDIAILNLLQEDGRMTHKEISFKTKKSLSAVQVRITKMIKSGVIEKFTTLLNRKKVGRGLAIYTMIKLKDSSKTALSEFTKAAIGLDEVMECYHMSGEYDFTMKIVLEDMEAYNKFIQEKLSLIPHIATVKSLFVIDELKYEVGFKL